MSVKISTRPRVGMGLSTKETRELIIDFETTGLKLDGGLDDDGIYRPPFLVIDVGVIGVDAELGDTFFLDTLVEHGSPQDALDQIAAIPALVEMHTENGLVDDLERRVSGDAKGMPFEEIEDFLLALIPDGQKVTLGGSGVASFDRPILNKYMPALAARLNFFPDDIGIERRSYRRATGAMLVPHRKDFAHRGFEDARTHLEEMRAFRDYHRRAARLIAEEDARIAQISSLSDGNVRGSDHDVITVDENPRGDHREEGSSEVLRSPGNHGNAGRSGKDAGSSKTSSATG